MYLEKSSLISTLATGLCSLLTARTIMQPLFLRHANNSENNYKDSCLGGELIKGTACAMDQGSNQNAYATNDNSIPYFSFTESIWIMIVPLYQSGSHRQIKDNDIREDVTMPCAACLSYLRRQVG
jgi:hypothetical protein